MAPKVRFGINTAQDGVEWSHLEDFWRFLDRETAFQSVWTMDHFVPPLPDQDSNGPCLEGWTALAAAAQATERLRVGCLVSGVTYRHPSVLAKMAATVDHISNGRLDFGIGAAWHGPEHNRYGIPFPSVREREDRLEEAVRLIRLLFRAEGPVDFDGEYYRLHQAPFSPRCLQRPHAPIFVGGGGEKRTLRTVARHADGMNVMGSVDAVRRKVEVLRRHCVDAGRDPNEITKSVVVEARLIDDEREAQQEREGLAPRWTVPPEHATESVPVGSAGHIRSVIERLADAGVTHVISLAHVPYDFDMYRRISDEVVSAFA
jgi:F420-dependent oxidoreductase-like protein